MNNSSIFPVFILYMSLTGFMVTSMDCPRWESKLVRRVLKKEIFPLYQQLNVVIPPKCPFEPSMDVYGYQEANKFEESSAKWVCDLCGKSFYEERFLDQHFDNRHPETKRQGPKFVCLASLCDVFRCEVIMRASREKASYWDHALCKEEDLQKKHDKCLDIINECVPNVSTNDVSSKIFDHLNVVLCSHLTCDRYWELQDNEVSPLSLVYYIMAGMILAIGLVIYFILLRSQLSQNTTSLFDNSQNERQQKWLRAPENQEIRYRFGVSDTRFQENF